MLIWKFDGTLSFNNPLNVIFKTMKLIRLGNSSHLSDTTSSTEQNLRFPKLSQDFCSFVILRICSWWRYLWRDCYNSLFSYFPAFGLNTERYSVSLCIQSECEKIRSRKPPNADTFHAVLYKLFAQGLWRVSLKFFLEYSNANKSFLVYSIHGCSMLGFHQWLQLGDFIRWLFLVGCQCSNS